jgi:tetratricopeptide (TPR) repeat protein
MNSRKRRNRQRTVCFAIASVLLGLLPFVVIESLLRLAGVGSPSSYQDPFIGFSQLYPLFELDSDAEVYRTARYHHNFFGLQEFPAAKEPTTFRVFCLGGSTVLGHPYDTDTAFPEWLAIELAGRNPERHCEVINCGGMSYASYRLIPILEEVLNHDPDLIVVMTGHNEFLEDRTYQAVKQRSAARVWVDERLQSLRIVTVGRRAMNSLRGGPAKAAGRMTLDQQVETRLDHESGYASYHRDEQWWNGITEHFDLNLRVMVQLCRRASVPILLMNPGSNVRDCSPLKSEHRADLAPQQLAKWNECFETASEVEAADPAGALALYKSAEAIDDQHARLIYRIARCLDRLERYDEARRAYVRAKELDVCPLRILDAMQQSVFNVAETTSTPVVDAAGLLEQQSRHGIAGFDWYVDQVHPSVRGHQLIAQEVAARLFELKIFPSEAGGWNRHARRRAYRRHMDGLSPQYFAAGRRRVEWLDHWSRRDRLRDDTQPQDARSSLDLGNSYVELGEYEKARAAYRNALRLDPACATQLMERALQLFQSGRSSAAERVARIVVELDSDQPVTHQANVALAVLAFEGGRTEEAMEQAKEVRTDSPTLKNTSKAWLEELPDAKDLFE